MGARAFSAGATGAKAAREAIVDVCAGILTRPERARRSAIGAGRGRRRLTLPRLESNAADGGVSWTVASSAPRVGACGAENGAPRFRMWSVCKKSARNGRLFRRGAWIVPDVATRRTTTPAEPIEVAARNARVEYILEDFLLVTPTVTTPTPAP